MKLRIAKKILKAQRAWIEARKDLVRYTHPRLLNELRWPWQPFTLPQCYSEPPHKYSVGQRYAAAKRLITGSKHREPLRHEAGYMIPANRVKIDDSLDLAIERAGGRADRQAHGAPEPTPAPATAPVFRRDGQVHNFGALPWPGKDPRHHLTRARYDARYAGARPVPKRGSHTFDQEG